MIKIIKNNDLTRFVGACIVIVSIFIFGGCRWVKMNITPGFPKQGDIVEVEITASTSSKLTQIEYRINDDEGIINSVPATIPYNTCKEQGVYHTSISTWSKATYNDGITKTFGPKVYELTTGKISRENNNLTYDLYVSEDDDEYIYNILFNSSEAFYDEFDSYSISHYRNAEPRFYTNHSINFANSVEMAISFGHGNHHIFKAGRTTTDVVDLSDTEFGNLSPCNRTGDLEYLVFASCCVLSLDHVGKSIFSGKWFVAGEPTSVAFGDVDGDGKDELGIAVKSSSIFGSSGYLIFDNLDANFNRLHSGGVGLDVTSIAFGDVDGDGKDEVGVATKEDGRVWVFDDSEHGFNELFNGAGLVIGDDNAIAFGDVDGDGKDEVGVATKDDGGVWVFDDSEHGFNELFYRAGLVGDDNSIAFGDVDGDGKDELGIAIDNSLMPGYLPGYLIFDNLDGNSYRIHAGGIGWHATSIAFGDVDGDKVDEVGITRKTNGGNRYVILDDKNHGFYTLHTGGDSWGSINYATSIAFGDVDGDAKDEIGIARKAGINQRYFILDDTDHDFRELHRAGSCWLEDAYARSIAFGDVDGDGNGEVGIASNKKDFYQTGLGNYSGVWVVGDYPDDPHDFGSSFKYWWFHNENTKLSKRPFTGLHMVLGFRTFFTINESMGSKFLKAFAKNLDDGLTIIDSWFEAAMDELPYDYGKNRAAALYLKTYENDTILSNKDDYIFGNENYSQQWVDYLSIEY